MTVQQWQERIRPPRLEKRYEFDSYDSVRDFLDAAAELSEQKGLYPDIGFGTTYANITIHADEGSSQLTDEQRNFATLLDSIDTENKA